MKAFIFNIRRYIIKYLQPFSPKIYWLSMGENCLPDDILKRHGLKSFSTPYSHARSNLDYVLFLEVNKYKGLLDQENLIYNRLGNKTFVRSTIINVCDNIYVDYHMKGFETSHFDLINSEEHRKSFNRKIQRLLKIRGKKNTVFFYHHRIHDQSNLELICQKAFEFTKFYSKPPKQCHVVVFFQKLIGIASDRKVHYKKVRSNIHFFEFQTEQIWAGNDPDLFWARKDDDLIKKMIDTSVRIVKSKENVIDGIIP